MPETQHIASQDDETSNQACGTMRIQYLQSDYFRKRNHMLTKIFTFSMTQILYRLLYTCGCLIPLISAHVHNDHEVYIMIAILCGLEIWSIVQTVIYASIVRQYLTIFRKQKQPTTYALSESDFSDSTKLKARIDELHRILYINRILIQIIQCCAYVIFTVFVYIHLKQWDDEDTDQKEISTFASLLWVFDTLLLILPIVISCLGYGLLSLSKISLEKSKYEKTMQSLSCLVKTITDQSTCSICQEGIIQNQCYITLPCNESHIYHKDCISQWLKSKMSCPTCRQQIN